MSSVAKLSTKIVRYQNTDVPRQVGEVGRLRVIKGANEGMIFVVKDSSVTLGRGEEADVVIGDLKASRKHARIDYTQTGWVVNDLGSSNGILYQGEYVRKFQIQSGEHFTLGDTIFEFICGSEQTRVLRAPMKSALEVAHLDQNLISQRLKIKNLANPLNEVVAKRDLKKTLLVYGAMIVAAVYFFQDDLAPALRPLLIEYGLMNAPRKPASTPAQEKEKKEELQKKALNSYVPIAGVTPEVGKTAEQYYRQGFREFREGNYLRAQAQFELAIQVNPNHVLARKGLISAEHEIQVEVNNLKSGAEKALYAGRLKEAKGYYETAQRLMFYDRSNPDYIECEEAIKKINQELTGSY